MSSSDLEECQLINSTKVLLSNWKHFVGAQIFPSRITSANWKQLNEQNAVTTEDSGKCSVAIILPNRLLSLCICIQTHMRASLKIYSKFYVKNPQKPPAGHQKERPCFSTDFVINIKTMIEQKNSYLVIWRAYFPAGELPLDPSKQLEGMDGIFGNTIHLAFLLLSSNF